MSNDNFFDKHGNVKKFVEDTISPYVKGLSDKVDQDIEKHEHLGYAEKEPVDQEFEQVRQDKADRDFGNVDPTQGRGALELKNGATTTVTVSSSAPPANAGEEGDLWLQPF